MTDAYPADELPRPFQPDPGAAAPRPTLGPGYDWLLEFLRQIYRPLLGAICVLGLANNYLLARPEARLDEGSLMILCALAGALAGIRAAELTFIRPAR